MSVNEVSLRETRPVGPEARQSSALQFTCLNDLYSRSKDQITDNQTQMTSPCFMAPQPEADIKIHNRHR